MALRPQRSGTIRVSRVSPFFDMFSALGSGRQIAFQQIPKPSGGAFRSSRSLATMTMKSSFWN
jgi:DNA end-binding protein Ku